MTDFRAAPIPQGLLEEYIRAKSQSPLSSGLAGLSSGMDKGLQLTETIGKIKSDRENRKKIEEVVNDPKVREAVSGTLGEGGTDVFLAGVRANPVEGMKSIVDIFKAQETSKRAEQNMKLKRALAVQAMTGKESDKSIIDAYKQFDVAKKNLEMEDSEQGQMALDSAIATFTNAYNSKYPNNAIPSYEEAQKVLFEMPGFLGGKAITTKTTKEKGKHFVGEVIESKGKKYKVTSIANPNDPEVEEIK